MSPFKTLARFGLDAFLLGLIGAVVLAVVWPDLGRSGGLIHLDLFTNYGVAVVFLLYGLTLSAERLKAGLLNWRLHLLVQGATFLLFPLLVWGLGHLAGGRVSDELKLGFFYLAASPSTISSSVAMTSIAKGNVAGAVFNASLSSLIGVLATPLWVDWYLAQSGHGLDLGAVVLKITLLVLAPIVLGQLLRPWLFGWLSRHLGLVKLLDRATILAIVFNSFADSMAEGIWSGHGVQTLASIAGLALGLFFAVFLLLDLACALLGFSQEDRIAGVFCGTKKSLAAGVPMAKVMFGASATLGVVIAPIMVYHFLQLVAASVIARRWGARLS
jgi:sodium/bile acid cotransporter 7